MEETAVIDQMGRTVQVPTPPRRIISLVPSQTELLFDLGLDAEVVGVTKFCVHPAEKVRTRQSIGGTKKVRRDVVDALQPDLIIGNKEENTRMDIEALAAAHPVWMSDIYTLADALWMIRAIGKLVGQTTAATTLADEINRGFAALPRGERPLRAGYFIWQKPLMCVGQHTFIHDVLTRCGFENGFAGTGNGRYPQVTKAEVAAAHLDVIFLSSEPFPFTDKHRRQFQAQFPETAVHLVDGEFFSWYGSRLLLAIPYLRQLIISLHTLP